MKKLLKDEVIKFLFGLISTTLGVLIALLINSYVDKQRDEKAYKLMLKAINIEATENQKILNESFILNYKPDNIVLREFNLKISDEIITNTIFLDHVSPDILKVMITYSMNLNRANNFRERDEKYKYEEKLYKKWQPKLTIAFKRVIDNCNSVIKDTIARTNLDY